MATVFDLFRRKERSSVTVNHVRTYLTSAFRVMFKLQPGLAEDVSADACYGRGTVRITFEPKHFSLVEVFNHCD